jgi:hypothetical protein
MILTEYFSDCGSKRSEVIKTETGYRTIRYFEEREVKSMDFEDIEDAHGWGEDWCLI